MYCQKSVCVRCQGYGTGRGSRSRWAVRFVGVKEEDHGTVRPTQSVQVYTKHPSPPHTNYRLLFNYSINISLSGSMTVFVFCVCMIFLVHCGWSSWSPWGECLGPCGVQSVQWSFRSPNNPSKHGSGRQCRGIYRKARR